MIFIHAFYRYKCIVKYKTAFYSFYLPVALAMLLVRITKLALFLKWVRPE